MAQKQFLSAILLLIFVCGAYSQRLNLDDNKNINIKSLSSYNKWRSQNKRNYLNDDEQLFRQLIFLENLKKVDDHNSNPKKTYKVATNQFSDMTQEEFVSRVLNSNVIPDSIRNLEQDISVSYQSTTPTVAASIDWRTKGAVTPVKNQGRCGSCWTFSTTGLMEGFNFVKNGTLKNFSEQQLLDCAIPANGYNTLGCKGGSAYYGLTYIMQYGAVEGSAYPYVGVQGTCQVKSVTTGFKPKTLARIGNTVDALKVALNTSPVSVAVDATLFSMYSSGIFNSCPTPLMLNHAVLAVGYDAQGNWIVKNSWGAAWGDQGFIKMAAGNTCGIAQVGFIITS